MVEANRWPSAGLTCCDPDALGAGELPVGLPVELPVVSPAGAEPSPAAPSVPVESVLSSPSPACNSPGCACPPTPWPRVVVFPAAPFADNAGCAFAVTEADESVSVVEPVASVGGEAGFAIELFGAAVQAGASAVPSASVPQMKFNVTVVEVASTGPPPAFTGGATIWLQLIGAKLFSILANPHGCNPGATKLAAVAIGIGAGANSTTAAESSRRDSKPSVTRNVRLNDAPILFPCSDCAAIIPHEKLDHVGGNYTTDVRE